MSKHTITVRTRDVFLYYTENTKADKSFFVYLSVRNGFVSLSQFLILSTFIQYSENQSINHII